MEIRCWRSPPFEPESGKRRLMTALPRAGDSVSCWIGTTAGHLWRLPLLRDCVHYVQQACASARQRRRLGDLDRAASAAPVAHFTANLHAGIQHAHWTIVVQHCLRAYRAPAARVRRAVPPAAAAPSSCIMWKMANATAATIKAVTPPPIARDQRVLAASFASARAVTARAIAAAMIAGCRSAGAVRCWSAICWALAALSRSL